MATKIKCLESLLSVLEASILFYKFWPYTLVPRSRNTYLYLILFLSRFYGMYLDLILWVSISSHITRPYAHKPQSYNMYPNPCS
ncbi:hypothetical protein CISIN_1g034796mg [Citrus sinensis]|uniref:Uncharacterized protein n=2 Tax=Citrus TaxID=2706 RepID=A0A067G415_CITSI|nr:hypothetical protein CISIN_1g034796mg [Citrus sinensis]